MKTLLKNAKVRLGKNSFADAIGFDFEDGKIIFAGFESKADKNEFREVIDCKGSLVLPSFWDGHLHFVKGSLVTSHLDLRNAATEEEFRSEIKKYIKEKNPDWVPGGYFSEANFKEEINLDKNFFDSITAEIPMMISRFDTHSAFVNSKAIELAGLNSKKNSFTEDELPTDVNGELTGEVKERAREYVLSQIPGLSISEIKKIVKERMRIFHSYGITSVSDITLEEDLDVYEQLLNDEELDLFINSQLPFQSFHKIEGVQKRFTSFRSHIKFNCFKAFYDGSLSSKTALFHDNYKSSKHNGMRTDFVSSGEFFEIGNEMDKKNYQMCVHAIGDKAVTELLDFVEKLRENYGSKDRRFKIEHAQHIIEDDIRRFKDLEVIASVQPSHLFSDAKTAMSILNDYSGTHNYKKLIEQKTVVNFGTDFPVVSENPFETIYYAMTRKTKDGDSFLPELKIDLDDCITSYTEKNAFAAFEERNMGILREGYSADIVVLEDIYKMKPDEIKNVKADMTYFKGRRIY